jgi:hypothetical protein
VRKVETLIFHRCPFAKNCWNAIGVAKESNKENQKISEHALCNGGYNNNVLDYLVLAQWLDFQK